jgi:hypothetical protein
MERSPVSTADRSSQPYTKAKGGASDQGSNANHVEGSALDTSDVIRGMKGRVARDEEVVEEAKIIAAVVALNSLKKGTAVNKRFSKDLPYCVHWDSVRWPCCTR